LTARALARIGHDVAGRIATITHNFTNQKFQGHNTQLIKPGRGWR
jgi:hypothetical protein